MRLQFIKNVFILLAVLTVPGACSIYDHYPDCKQCTVRVELRDSVGGLVPSDSASDVVYLYYFVNGSYKGMIPRESNGRFRLLGDEGDSITYVAVAGRRPDQYDLNTPVPGESIHDVWLQLRTQRAEVSQQPAAIYYGKATSEDFGEDEDGTKVFTLRDIRSRVRVWVRGLKRRFGDGNYRILIEGLRSGLQYDGATGGEYVNYETQGAFETGNNDIWKTQPITVLPSTGATLSLKIYKQDGTLLFNRTEDEEGKPLVLKSDKDVVLVVAASDQGDFTIKVVPYEDVMNNNVFQ